MEIIFNDEENNMDNNNRIKNNGAFEARVRFDGMLPDPYRASDIDGITVIRDEKYNPVALILFEFKSGKGYMCKAQFNLFMVISRAVDMPCYVLLCRQDESDPTCGAKAIVERYYDNTLSFTYENGSVCKGKWVLVSKEGDGVTVREFTEELIKEILENKREAND